MRLLTQMGGARPCASDIKFWQKIFSCRSSGLPTHSLRSATIDPSNWVRETLAPSVFRLGRMNRYGARLLECIFVFNRHAAQAFCLVGTQTPLSFPMEDLCSLQQGGSRTKPVTISQLKCFFDTSTLRCGEGSGESKLAWDLGAWSTNVRLWVAPSVQ
jgi:hypothetical protein